MDLKPIFIAAITAAMLMGLGVHYGTFKPSPLEGSMHLHKINFPDVTSSTLGPVRMDDISMHFGLLGPGDPVFNKTIPKHIWTFWTGCIPQIILSFVANWCNANPGYQITIMTLENYHEYLDIEDLQAYYSEEFAQRLSDIARVHAIAKHGGFWVDSSILMTESLDWAVELQTKEKAEFIGYYIKADTTTFSSPVIENWFFGAVPGSRLMEDWRREYMRLQDYQDTQGYLQHLKERNINLQRIGSPVYLAQHSAMQAVIQNGLANGTKYRFYLMDTYTGPYKFLVERKWNAFVAIKQLPEQKELQHRIMKIRGWDRSHIRTTWWHWRALLWFTSIEAQDFFSAFGVNYKAQKNMFCNPSPADNTCTAIQREI
ncbi:hypothetical protein CEUSTIGMA_g10489.t1 [Chlamydomonas eustigma]|uniref:Alpha 1,4-glycosyltransferase domain-containing protein n=1 Tax=Chlamydomonas eustigma TaxID=1157962 RepID=A0A250XJ51_9CHLO|nr:hypothetical protein CEUSTIGMA_g10489.t1 [Chlamydomonas eustigma]|eukprot:GAX83063.1 hypothetical protein CEUSTIGMA_g10489.t1 [Chlamydomonas eustigma]